MLDVVIHGWHRGGWHRPRRVPLRCRHQGRSHRAHRRRDHRSRRAQHRRHRQARDARVHRRAHALRRPGVLGRRPHAVSAARHHDRHRRQLRLHHRTAALAARRLPDADAGAGRGHAAHLAAARCPVGHVAELRRVARPARRHAGRERRVHGRALRAAPPGHGRAGRRGRGDRRRPGRDGAPPAREPRGGRLRLHLVVGHQPQRRQRRPGAVAPRHRRGDGAPQPVSSATTRAPTSSSSPPSGVSRNRTTS